MANELTIAARLSYYDAEGVSAELELLASAFSAGAKKILEGRMTVTAGELAIPLGSVATLGWFVGKNLDATNDIFIRITTGGSKFCRMKPGEPALFRFGTDVTAPWAITSAGSCDMQYILVSG